MPVRVVHPDAVPLDHRVRRKPATGNQCITDPLLCLVGRQWIARGIDQIVSFKGCPIINVVVLFWVLLHRLHAIRALDDEFGRLWMLIFLQTPPETIPVSVAIPPEGILNGLWQRDPLIVII